MFAVGVVSGISNSVDRRFFPSTEALGPQSYYLMDAKFRSENDAVEAGWGDRLGQHRGRLRRMVELRLNLGLRGRIDPSDVIQDVFPSRPANDGRSIFNSPIRCPSLLWLRFLTGQRLLLLQRRHLGTKARDASREVSIHRGAMPGASTAVLAASLLGRDTSASEVLFRAERRLRVQQAIDGLDPIDRELIVLRHFEQLTNGECARVLGLTKSAASKRYFRALEQLKQCLTLLPGGPAEFRT